MYYRFKTGPLMLSVKPRITAVTFYISPTQAKTAFTQGSRIQLLFDLCGRTDLFVTVKREKLTL